MKERPILFSDEMVRAILAGTKTQTRRVIPEALQLCRSPEDEPEWFVENCRYGADGDRLWVRESWKLVNWQWEDAEQKIMYSDGSSKWVYPESRHVEEKEFGDWLMREYERVTKHPAAHAILDPRYEDDTRWEMDERALPWRPGIFMPRWMSRITLEITGIRVERVQDISNGDARAEGVEFEGIAYRNTYAKLWNRLNAKRGFGWDTNPWVWVIEFNGKDFDRKTTRGCRT